LLSAGHSSLWHCRLAACLHALQSDSTSHAAFRIYDTFIKYKVNFVGFKNDFTKLLDSKTRETHLLSTHKAADMGQSMISSAANRTKS